ncbi:MAG: LPO_1073/Vpar_1526 family protein [Rikenellaceae bacterium]
MGIESGDNSTNTMIAGDVNISGITYSEARQIALDVFKSNFYELAQVARSIAENRAEEITNKLIDRLYAELPQHINKLNTPAVQYSIFNIQKEYAKTGDENLQDKLLDLFAKRISAEERSLEQITLDEAIEVLPKLTQDQINALTLIFSVIYCRHRNIVNKDSFNYLINDKMALFTPQVNTSYSFYAHLQYVGCCTILPVGGKFKKISEIFSSRYFVFFSKGFSMSQFNDEFKDDAKRVRLLLLRCFNAPQLYQFNYLTLDELDAAISKNNLNDLKSKIKAFAKKIQMNDAEITQYLSSISDNMSRLISLWGQPNSDISCIKPTSVGFAIAIVNYNIVTGENVHISTFV